MAMNDKHPLYSEFSLDWQTMRDTYRGERVVKEKAQLYLPATMGMHADGMNPNAPGYNAYQAYKMRAVFHDFVAEAVEAAIGMMHQKPPTIELPDALEPMRQKATINGEPLEHLLRRINEQQLVTGRLGLLLDFPTNPTTEQTTPYIATYMAEHILNWDDGATEELSVMPTLNLVVLDESNWQRENSFTWKFKNKYRVLTLGSLAANEMAGVYGVGVYEETSSNFSEELQKAPSVRGKTLDKIPFVFVNTKDIVARPDDPPLLGLAKLSLAIYRGEADYRQNLFMQGQDTMVIIGGGDDDDIRVGADAILRLPISGDAKYVGVSSQGLAEQRQSLENDKMAAANKAGELIDTRSKQKESGDALGIRVAAQTATLNQIALTGAMGLEKLLRIAAKWVGADPDKVKVTPNLDFVNDEMNSKTLVELMTAKRMGAPLSLQSIHNNMQEKGLTQLTLEEELALIMDEDPLAGGTDAGGDPNQDPQQ